MKQIVKKWTALLLAAALLAACASPSVSLPWKQQEAAEVPAALPPAQSAGESEPAEPAESSRKETVYVIADAAGGVEKVIVSEQLQKKLAEAQGSGKRSLVYNAEGDAVDYRGDIEAELPIRVHVRYFLDGKEISPKKLAGKSGRVTIRFDYENLHPQAAEVGGKQTQLYAPFAVVSGMLLDHETFSNIEVTNGRLIDDGTRTIAVGLALPGLAENLALSEDRAEKLPSYVEVSADARDFSLDMTLTVAIDDMFDEMDLDELDDLDELFDGIDEMQDAMGDILEGSHDLTDGLDTLLEKCGELYDGVLELNSGARKLNKGADKLDTGAYQIERGARRMQSGLREITANNDTLNGAAKQVFEALLDTANAQLAESGLGVPKLTIQNYAATLKAVIASLDEGKVYEKALGQVEKAVEAQRDTIEAAVTKAVRAQVAATVTDAAEAKVRAQVTEAVRGQVTAAVTAQVKRELRDELRDELAGATPTDAATPTDLSGMLAALMQSPEVQAQIEAAVEEQMDEMGAAVDAAVAAQIGSDEVQAAIGETIEAQMKTEEVRGLIAQNVQAQMKLAVSNAMKSDEVQAQLAAAAAGAKQLIELKTSLDDYDAFYTGLKAYTDGVTQVAQGAAELVAGAQTLTDGAEALHDGTERLYDGTQEMKDKMPDLIDGVTELRDGSQELLDGLREFDDEGVQELADKIGGDLEETVDRLRETVNVARRWRAFPGLGAAENCKFIYRTGSIE